MRVDKPYEYAGKEVVDVNGNTIGTIDKIWKSWNTEYPGYFFGIIPHISIRDTWFRGTNKLIPIYSDYIKEATHHLTLNKTLDQLAHFWNKTVPCGKTRYPIDDLVERGIYDKDHSRVGTLFSWVETEGAYKQYGCFVDPYLCDTWDLPHTTMMPMPFEYIEMVKETITLNKTCDELKEYWQKQKY
ncbi:MAG: hypothetical protein QCH96_05400 [Candidatus Thermoplasmatota archaeon]|nr:hypothetical protein [Candidatus Thermoplasmatota archaeon]